MNGRLLNFFKFSVAVGLTAYLISGSTSEAQRNSSEVQITDRNGKPVVLYKESHALVIWAGNYRHWTKLTNVEGEAKQVIEALQQQGFQVTLVGNPTGEEFERSVKKFIARYGSKPDNRLVIFYTGHGNTRHQTKGYLVPVDAPDPNIDESGFLRAAISMERVMTWAREIEAKHVLFVFDSCFSGTVFKTKSPPNLSDTYIRTITDKPVRQFLTAGDAGEEVPAQSIFTPLFIRAIEGEADYNQDGYITGSELGVYLTQTLPGYTQNRQSPQYGKIRDVDLDRGDIVFRPPLETIVSPLPNPSPQPTPSNTGLTRSTQLSPSPSTATIPISSLPLSSPDPALADPGNDDLVNDLLRQPSQTNSSPSTAAVPKPTPSPSTPLSQPGTTLISKATGVDYTELRNLLADGKWKEADQETTKAMLQAAGREKEGLLWTPDIENFSCEDLQIIDRLWLKSSTGKFGFSIQKEIWKKVGSPTEHSEVEMWREFYIEIGWKTKNSGTQSSRGYINYSDLEGFKDIERAARGNLPGTSWGAGTIQGRVEWGDEVSVLMDDGKWVIRDREAFFSRVAHCNFW